MVLPSFPAERLVGVQARLKKHAPHAVFILRHLLQLACVQAAISMPGINVYTKTDTLIEIQLDCNLDGHQGF